jgi:translocator protein
VNVDTPLRPNRTTDLLGLVLAVALCLAAGAIASVATADDVRTWYPTLAKPPFTPPSWLFAPVWTVLYVLMGVSLWLLWRTVAPGPARSRLLLLFALQLALNALWSIVFFAWRAPALALVEIVLLWLAIALLIRGLLPLHRQAALLLVPYLAWVSFATLLNAAIVVLN